MPDTIIGLDIGGTKIAVVEGTLDGQILARSQFATQSELGFEATFERLCTSTKAALATARNEGRAPVALSVSIGGPLDIAQGIIYSPPNLPGWDNIPLKELLSTRLGLPVFVEHDGNAGALAEWHFGAGSGTHSMIFLTMGTGLGGGMILNDRLWRGASDCAGEVGHMRIAPDGPPAYNKRGSWEGLCAGPAFAIRARSMFPNRWPTITTPELVGLALASDNDALQVVQHIAQDLGNGLALLADMLNPEMIVIGSMAVRLGEVLLKPTREFMRLEALPNTYSACRLVPAKLGEQIGDIAALCAAIEALRLGPSN